jgi:hypothetical protein
MRNAILASILTVVLVVSAAAVWAGPPVSGTWTSPADFDNGTATTKWAGTNFIGAGNTIYGRSSSGGVFTNDWIVQCPTVIAVIPIVPFAGANGNAIYQINYSGGYVVLGGPGNPWDGGDAQYTGTVSTYIEIRTITYAGSKIKGAVSDHAITAQIQGYNDACLTWGIANGTLRGGANPTAPLPFDFTVLQSVKSAAYPDYPGAGCVLGPNGPGHWEDIDDITISVAGCSVATAPSTWGAVKAKYRD